MQIEFSGIERRLDELSERLARLQPLGDRDRIEFDQDPYLRDIVERNLEIAARCCIDISHRIISPSRPARSPRLGGVVPAGFARHLAPLAGFRNILVHEYMRLDWDQVVRALHRLEDLERFAALVRRWLRQRMDNLY